MSVEYLDLADYVGIAAAVTGLDEGLITKVAKLDLADSALHAPAAGFGDDDFYPDLVDKAAALIVRLAKNHPLPDGNKRVAWVALRYFLVLNDWAWIEPPTVDEAEHAVLAIASGEWDEQRPPPGYDSGSRPATASRRWPPAHPLLIRGGESGGSIGTAWTPTLEFPGSGRPSLTVWTARGRLVHSATHEWRSCASNAMPPNATVRASRTERAQRIPG